MQSLATRAGKAGMGLSNLQGRKSMSNHSVAVLLCVVLILSSGHVLRADDGETAGRDSVQGFNLKDYRGKEYSLSDFQKSKFVVGIFLGTECPLAKLYAQRLAKLSEEYGPKGVTFVGFNSNQQDSLTEIASYARQHSIKFPILKNLGNTFADQVGAERTPEVLVWDDEGLVRYRGRIDDQFGVGYVRNEPTRHDLTIALADISHLGFA